MSVVVAGVDFKAPRYAFNDCSYDWDVTGGERKKEGFTLLERVLRSGWRERCTTSRESSDTT
ncbi:MAG TPA: hypothetical protein VKR56_08540 [Candidatus Cybelea sp.]|nr:hypothetical protein [Candidatus Cybelea sp.]